MSYSPYELEDALCAEQRDRRSDAAAFNACLAQRDATIAKLEAKVSDLEGDLRSRLEDAASLALANGLRADAAERRIAKAIDVLLNNDIARCVAEAVAVLRGE